MTPMHRKSPFILSLFLLATSLIHSFAAEPVVFVEAEAFADRGGWKVDTQFIPIMGSPFLLAHGLGTPVDDATTTVSFPETGTYQVWVRTRDWVAPWDAEGAPGKFELLVNGKKVEGENVLGTVGAEWHWQPAGSVEVGEKEAEVTLKDLTGFNGRCDCIVFTKDEDLELPDEKAGMIAFRREHLGLPEEAPLAGEYDLVIIGGGYAGTAAAISAARQSLTVALIQDRPVLGGNGSSEVRVWAKGKTRINAYPRVGEIVEEFSDNASNSPGAAHEFVDDLKEEKVRAEENIDLFLNHHAFEVAMAEDGENLHSVTALDTMSGEEKRFIGRFFLDSTGHGTIGELAGAEFTMLLEGHLGMSNMWYTEDTGQPQSWQETPWALPLESEDFPELRAATWDGKPYMKGEWFWESGFNKHPIDDLEQIRDWNLRAVFGAFSALKREQPEKFQTHSLAWVAYIGGNRESRLLQGDVVLTEEDVISGKQFEDGLVASSWSLDLHYPKEEFMKKFPDNPFISRAVHGKFDGMRKDGYLVPYRCLYSKNIGNMFMAGRNISVSHEALGTIRVMRTCGMMGEVVGKAAYLAKRHDTDPRGVYESHLDALKELCRQPGWARRDSLTADLYVPPGGPVFLPAHIEYVDPSTLDGIVVDDTEAKLKGSWKSGEGLQSYIGDHYIYHSVAGDAEARFEFFVPKAGNYEVRYAYQNHENRAKNAPVSVVHAGGTDKIILNQTEPPKGENSFQTLGTYAFEPGKKYYVSVTNEGVDGNVHADAVQVVEAK